MRRAASGVLAVALAVVLAAPAGAAAPRADFTAVEPQLMCDTCNVPLPIAVSTRADQERAQIRRLIAQGKTEQEILDVFVAEYGPNVLADPQKAGGSPAVWAVPLAILAAAIAAIAALLPRWRRRRREEEAAAPGAAAPELSAADRERLERDLALYER